MSPVLEAASITETSQTTVRVEHITVGGDGRVHLGDIYNHHNTIVNLPCHGQHTLNLEDRASESLKRKSGVQIFGLITAGTWVGTWGGNLTTPHMKELLRLGNQYLHELWNSIDLSYHLYNENLQTLGSFCRDAGCTSICALVLNQQPLSDYTFTYTLGHEDFGTLTAPIPHLVQSAIAGFICWMFWTSRYEYYFLVLWPLSTAFGAYVELRGIIQTQHKAQIVAHSLRYGLLVCTYCIVLLYRPSRSWIFSYTSRLLSFSRISLHQMLCLILGDGTISMSVKFDVAELIELFTATVTYLGMIAVGLLAACLYDMSLKWLIRQALPCLLSVGKVKTITYDHEILYECYLAGLHDTCHCRWIYNKTDKRWSYSSVKLNLLCSCLQFEDRESSTRHCDLELAPLPILDIVLLSGVVYVLIFYCVLMWFLNVAYTPSENPIYSMIRSIESKS